MKVAVPVNGGISGTWLKTSDNTWMAFFPLNLLNISNPVFHLSLLGVASHTVDGAQLPPANQVKSEGVQSNGPSHPPEAPPPASDNNSNGCSQPTAPTLDRNGSLEPLLDHRDTAPDRPAKRCRTEAEPVCQSEVEPSRTQENWWLHSWAALTNRHWLGGEKCLYFSSDG